MQFPEYDSSTFKTVRKVLGVTQTELADICRTTRQTVLNVENGHCASEPMITLMGLALDGLTQEASQEKKTVVDILWKRGTK